MPVNIYTSQEKKWRKAAGQVRISDNELSVKSVSHGIVLPVRCKMFPHPLSIKRFYEGGVVDTDYRFIAGFDRDRTNPRANFSCRSAYVPHEIPEYIDETVIFGGFVFSHFGHLLADGLSRIWYALKHPEISVVFMSFDNEEPFPFAEFLDLLGIRYFLVEQIPIQFKEILVPEEAVFSLEMYANRKWLTLFDMLRNRYLKDDTPQKIYLTRTQYQKQDGINENYFEDFYQHLGYTVISPEKLSLPEQIGLMANARDIACTMGTLSHLALFAQEGARLDILLRDPASLIKPQLLIGEARRLKTNIIEATKNILPTHHADGVFLYYPTRFFQAFCEEHAYPYTPIDFKIFLQEHLYDYLKLYTENYQNEFTFKKIRRKTLFDLIDSLSYAFFEKHVKRNALGARDFIKAYDALVELEAKEAEEAELVVYGYIQDTGWQRLDGARISPKPLTSLKIVTKIPYVAYVYLQSFGWMGSAGRLPFGSFDFCEPLRNFSMQADNIVYRAHDGNRWTDFRQSGDNVFAACGNDIYGLQIFFEQ